MTQFSTSTIDLPCAGVLHSVTIARPGPKGDTQLPVTDTAAAIIAACPIHAPENDDEPGEAPVMLQPRIAQALTAVDQRRRAAATVQMTIRSLCIYDMEPIGRPTWEEEPEQQDRGNEPGKVATVSAARYRGLVEQRGGVVPPALLDESGGSNAGWLIIRQRPTWPDDDGGQRPALLPSPRKPRSGGAAALLIAHQQQQLQEAVPWL